MNKQGIVRGRHAQEKWDVARRLRKEMTPAEAALWEEIRANRLDGYHFRSQQIIDGFIVDFYCHMAGLVIELDGNVHDAQTDYDSERDDILTRRGLTMLRFSNTRIEKDRSAVLEEIRTAAREGLPAETSTSPRRSTPQRRENTPDTTNANTR